MITIKQYKQGDIYKILLANNEQYQMQYMREDVLIANIAFTGYNEDDIVVGCAGLAELWDGVYEAWIALDERYKQESKNSILKTLKNCLDGMPNGVIRVHAHMNINTENYKHFMEFLGFEKEAELKNYFPNRVNCALYRRLY